MDDDLDNIIDFLNNKDFQASIQQSQVQDLQSLTIEGQQKCNDKQISQTNAKTQSFLENHLQQQQQPQLILSEAAYNLSSNSNFTLPTQQSSTNNQQNSSQLPLSTTALQNQVHSLNYQSHNINQNTSAAKTNQPTLNQNVQAKVLGSGTGISGSFKLNQVQQKDLIDKKHHALTNSNSLVYQQPLHSVTNKNQSLVSSNYSQNNNSLSNASGNGGSSKHSEFIIRKTQNKRVMSQIRHNTNNEGHGMKLPPKQSKHNIMSNSGKKSKKMSSGKKSFIQELQINQQQSSDNNDYSDQQLIYSNRPALQNINKNLIQDDQYRNQKKFILNTQGSTDNYQQFQNQRDSIESSQIKQQQQQLLFKQMINYSSNTEIVNQENLIVIDNQQNYDDNPQGAPDQSDKQVQEEQQQQQQISSLIKKKFLVFRPYEDPITLRPYQAPDRGYYFKLHKCDVKIVRYTLEDNGFRETPSQEAKDWTILWSCSALKPVIYQQLLKYQKVNHFPSSFYITRKDLMYKSVSKMREIHGQKHFNFIPKTFLLPNEFVYLEDEMKKDPSKLWIAKPAASSQGKGIIVTNKILEIPQKGTPHIVSEYINNPLLFDGFKFDLRVYVAITSINPLRLYVYEDGLTRFATSKYTNELSGNKKQSKYTHLTNYSLNKFNPNFVANNDANADGVGSKWSLIALKKAFRDQGIDDQLIFKKIEDVIIKTILSAENYSKMHFFLH